MEKGRNCSWRAISPLIHNIFSLLLRFYVRTGTRISLRDNQLFEITEVEIARVDCILISLNQVNSYNLFSPWVSYIQDRLFANCEQKIIKSIMSFYVSHLRGRSFNKEWDVPHSLYRYTILPLVSKFQPGIRQASFLLQVNLTLSVRISTRDETSLIPCTGKSDPWCQNFNQGW